MMTGAGDLSVIEPSTEQEIAAVVFQLNRDTPRDLGNGTRLDGVRLVDGGMQFKFTMTELSSDQIDAEDFHSFVFETSKAQICAHPQLREILESTRKFVEADYAGSDGTWIAAVRIKLDSCLAG